MAAITDRSDPTQWKRGEALITAAGRGVPGAQDAARHIINRKGDAER